MLEMPLAEQGSVIAASALGACGAVSGVRPLFRSSRVSHGQVPSGSCSAVALPPVLLTDPSETQEWVRCGQMPWAETGTAAAQRSAFSGGVS